MPDLTSSSGFSHLVKTFGGAKVVSTVMGMLLLAGGVGAGVALVMQPQETASIAYLLEPPLQVCGSNVCSSTSLTNGDYCHNSTSNTDMYCCPQSYTISGDGTTCVAPLSAGTCSPSDAGTQGNCPTDYRCSILGTCETNIGVGNCAIHSGNCYVHSSIGIEDTPGDNTTRDVCDYGGHWTTCEVGYVCSNYDCIPGPGGTPKPTKTPGTGTNPTPTPTPRVTPTPTPTPVGVYCETKKVFKDDSRNTPGAYYLDGNELLAGSNVTAGMKLVFSIKPAPTNINTPITITDQLPTNFNFLDSDSTCTYNTTNRMVSCLITTTNTQASFRVVVANGATGTLTNTATVVGNSKTTTCSTNVKVQISTPTPTPTVSPTPTATPVAVCSAETIYTPNWTLISATTFQTLPVGGQVYFCVNGTTSAGAFDMARFTINNTLRPEVTLRRPGFSDICDLYTIPANTYTFTVQGEIHHTTLGWR